MHLSALIKNFTLDRRGFVAVIFGVLVLPVMAIIGAAIDYRDASKFRDRLRAATEAVALAIARKNASQDPAVSSEKSTELMNSVFDANFPDDPSVTGKAVTIVEEDIAGKTAIIQATASYKTTLVGMIGFTTIDLAAEAKAGATSQTKPTVYVDFMLDATTSMGLPADGSLAMLNPQGCFLACHDDGAATRRNGQTPKMDVIWDNLFKVEGVAQTINTLFTTEGSQVLFSLNLFDYQNNVILYNEPYTGSFEDTTSPGDPERWASKIRALSYDGQNGGTDLTTSFSQLNDSLPPSDRDSRRVIVIVSDGLHSRAKVPYDPNQCTALKAKGDVYTVFIESKYEDYYNTNLTAVVPAESHSYPNQLVIDTWDWDAIRGTGFNDGRHRDGYGYYSGLNNAQLLMRRCASREDWAFSARTGDEIAQAMTRLKETITAPTIQIIY